MILERTGYPLDVTTGQRKYGGPPPNWEGPTPGTGCEVNLNILIYVFEIRFKYNELYFYNILRYFLFICLLS